MIVSMKDNFFSPIAREYARFRPTYPKELFSYLASIAPAKSIAWDCATGSGQAATSLADHFDRVIATDISDELLARATPHPRIEFRKADAAASGIDSASIDLITVANAMHWFHGEAFNKEVKRVLRPKGIIAAWSYAIAEISPEIDPILRHLHNVILDPFWIGPNRIVEHAYRDLELPFAAIATPTFIMEERFTLERLLGYLGTWSAAVKYRKHHGVGPVGLVSDELKALWGDPTSLRVVKWPMALRVARA